MIEIINSNNKYPHIFKIPSYNEYIEELNNLKNPPFYLSHGWEDKEELKNCQKNRKDKNYKYLDKEECFAGRGFDYDLNYEILFPLFDLPFIRFDIYRVWFYAGASYPFWDRVSGFLIKKNSSKTKIAYIKNNFLNEKLKNLFLFLFRPIDLDNADVKISFNLNDYSFLSQKMCLPPNELEDLITVIDDTIYLRDTYICRRVSASLNICNYFIEDYYLKYF